MKQVSVQLTSTYKGEVAKMGRYDVRIPDEVVALNELSNDALGIMGNYTHEIYYNGELVRVEEYQRINGNLRLTTMMANGSTNVEMVQA